MFGLYTLQMPAAIQARISAMSNRQQQGTLAGTRDHGRAVLADRHGLRRAGARRRAGRHRPERRRRRAAPRRCSR